MNTVDKTKKYTEEDIANVLALLIDSGVVVVEEETEGGEDEYYIPDRILR